MRRRLALLAPLAVLAAGACASRAVRTSPPPSVPWTAPSAETDHAAGARWAYTPTHASSLAGAIALDDGKKLYFGSRGERWLVDPAAHTVQAAGDLAEQDIVAAARKPGGGFTFVGRGGAVFEAPGPIDPFSRAVAPPEPIARADAWGSTIAAVTTRGQLLVSSDGGRTFARAKIDAPLVGDVTLFDGGHGVAIAYPEKLFATADGGSTWKPIDAPTVGALELVRETPSTAAVRGFSSTLVVAADGRITRRASLPARSEQTLEVDLPPAPDATDLRDGRGFFAEGEVFVVRPPNRKTKAWQLGRAKLGGRLELAPLTGSERCQRLVVDGDGHVLFGACSFETRGASLATTEILRWSDPSAPPDVLAATLEGVLGEARIAAAADGRMLAWGVCRPGGVGGCDATIPLVLSRWETQGPAPAASSASASAPAPAPSGSAPRELISPWITASATSLTGRPLAVRLSATGTAAYLVGRRGKSNELALFVSHDGGRSFDARDLDVAAGETDRRAGSLPGVTAAAISTAEEGLVSLVLEGTSGALVVLADEDGRPLGASSPPVSSPITRVGIAGRRALAVDGASVFETLDGGASWQSLGDVASLRCDDRGACEHRVACAPSGCLVGHDVARIGWGGAVEPRRASDLEPLAPTPFGMRNAPPPIVCRLGKEKWTPLPRSVVRPPTAGDADLGKTAWAMMVDDPARATVVMVHGFAATPAKIDETTLLPPERDPTNFASSAIQQVEGAVAIRFALPRNAATSSDVSVELGWENLLESKSGRVTLRDLGPGIVDAARFRGSALAAEANLGLVSISQGGLFVRGLGQAPLVFVDYRGKSDRTPFRGFSPVLGGEGLEVRVDAARVDGKSVGLGLVDGSGILRGSSNDAVSLAPPPFAAVPTAARLTFGYVGGASAIVEHAFVRDVGAWTTTIFPLRAEGPVYTTPIAGPTQALATERFRACSSSDRAKGPRIVALPDQGTRRAVIVEAPDGSRFAVLASDRMVLYGTADAPCVAAIDAVAVREDDPSQQPEEGDRVLVFPGDPEHGWFFRTGASESGGIDTRTMRCRIDANAQVPPSVERVLAQDVSPFVRKR